MKCYGDVIQNEKGNMEYLVEIWRVMGSLYFFFQSRSMMCFHKLQKEKSRFPVMNHGRHHLGYQHEQ